MKPYSELTRLGRLRRLRTVVFEALGAYDLDVAAVRYLTTETNTMFEVRDTDGERFVLRIYSDEETTLRENRAEMFWLEALVRDTDIKVTEPVVRRDGDYITIVTVDGVPKNRRCVLFKWVPGRTFDNYLNDRNYFAFGQALAKLHEHARTLNPLPPEIQPKRWDKVFYYPDEPVVYNMPEYAHLFSPERIALIDRVIELSNEVFDTLFADPKSLILIHGDLHYWNMHVYRGELYVIDFEDVNLGCPVQDVAVSLACGRRLETYPAWRAGFRSGYCSVRPWPAEDDRIIETLMAARTTMFINYAARVTSKPEDHLGWRFEELNKFLAVYG